jgi:phospholipid-binding lipoprotein MlaA
MLQACAAMGPMTYPDPRDPLEAMNRQVTGFNDVVDAAVLKPIATTYAQVVPGVVRTGVRNFFGNLGDVWSLANNAAQLKLRATGETALRVGMNTFLGLGTSTKPISDSLWVIGAYRKGLIWSCHC